MSQPCTQPKSMTPSDKHPVKLLSIERKTSKRELRNSKHASNVARICTLEKTPLDPPQPESWNLCRAMHVANPTGIELITFSRSHNCLISFFLHLVPLAGKKKRSCSLSLQKKKGKNTRNIISDSNQSINK